MTDFNDDIEKYRKGELTSVEMHALEKKALSDPFLADALEGADSISSEDFSTDISKINQQLLTQSKKSIWFTPLRIAAGIALLIGSVFLIVNFNQSDEQLALQNEDKSTLDTSNYKGSTANNDQPELLSLNRPKEEPKTESIPDLKTTGPTLGKTDGSGEVKPGPSLSTAIQTSPTVADFQIADQPIAAELSEIAAEEKLSEGEKVAAAEPAQLDLKKEIEDKDFVTRSQARKSKLTDDAQSSKVVRGQVTSAEDGLPLAGVSVLVKGTTTGTVTNMQGHYSLPIENKKQELVFSFIGLQTTNVSSNNKSIVDVKLLEDLSQVSEVVVTGIKSARDEKETTVIKLAEPVGGGKAYDTYLESNLHYPQQALENKVKGNVTIEFTIGTDGTLRDFSVMKSLGYGCDEEVTRLVKEGPKWTPSTEDNVSLESNVRVKMRFDSEKEKK